jgi:hypothetical protein
VTAPSPILAANTAFVVVFGIFAVAMAILVVVTVRWAVRHDRANWRSWRARQYPGVRPNSAGRGLRDNGRRDPPKGSGAR